MKTLRQQRRYRFRPPKYSPLLASFLIGLSDVFRLHGTFKIRKVNVEGVERVVDLVHCRQSVLITPNHADRADPLVLCHIGRRYKLPFHYMVAREGFEENRWLNSFVLQRCGAFSVDREGADLSAIRTAVKLLQECRYPLVIFPEGEIYHHQEALAPLNEGVASIVLQAAENLPEGKDSYVIPTALHYAYGEDVQATFSQRLAALEDRIGWKPRPHMEIVDRIYRLGSGILAIKEVEFLGQAQSGSIVERLGGLQEKLVERIELKHFGREREGSVPERVRTLRARIRKTLTDPEAKISEVEEEGLYDDLDTLFLALQVYSYPGWYLYEQPTIDRISETILKLEEDVLGKANYVTEREVSVRFGEPIGVREFLKDKSRRPKAGVRPLTELVSQIICTLISGMREMR